MLKKKTCRNVSSNVRYQVNVNYTFVCYLLSDSPRIFWGWGLRWWSNKAMQSPLAAEYLKRAIPSLAGLRALGVSLVLVYFGTAAVKICLKFSWALKELMSEFFATPTLRIVDRVVKWYLKNWRRCYYRCYAVIMTDVAQGNKNRYIWGIPRQLNQDLAVMSQMFSVIFHMKLPVGKDILYFLRFSFTFRFLTKKIPVSWNLKKFT